MTSPEERNELMYLYVIGSADDAERRVVEAWLATGDPAADAALAEARAVVAHLPLTLGRLEPSSAMWPALLGRLAKQTRPTPDVVTRDEPASLPMPHARLASASLIAGIAAAAALFAGLLVWHFARGDVRARETQLAEQRVAEIDNLRCSLEQQEQQQEQQRNADIAELREALRAQQEELDAISNQLRRADEALLLVSSPDVRAVDVAGTDELPDAAGRLLFDAASGALSFVARDLPDPGTSRAYELWFVTDPDGPVSLGTFRPDADGEVLVNVIAPRDLAAIAAFAVSIEPPGGSPEGSPSGPIVLLGPF